MDKSTDYNMSFKVDLSLQRLAAIAYANSFINEFKIQASLLQKIRHNHFKRAVRGERFRILDRYSYGKWFYSETWKLLKKLKERHIPNLILNEIICVIESLLKRNREWHEILVDKFKVHHTYSDAIYWTPHGTLDTAKIVTNEWTKWFDHDGKLKYDLYEDVFYGLHWTPDTLPPDAKKRFEDKQTSSYHSPDAIFAKYYMACACILSNYINSHCNKMLRLCEMWLKEESSRTLEIEFIISSVLFLMDHSKLRLRRLQKLFVSKKDIYKTIFKDLNSFEKKSRANAHMFSLSVKHGCDVASRYYWTFLSLEEKYDLIVPAAVNCYYDRHTTGFYVDIMVFLLMQMSEDQLRVFFNDIEQPLDFVTIFIDYLPWGELFFPAFEAIKLKFRLSKSDYSKLLKQIVNKMFLKSIRSENRDRYVNYTLANVGYDSEKTIYHRMFVTVFEDMRRHISNEKPLIPEYTWGSEFLELFNIPILQLMLDFECEDSYRKKRFLNPYNDDMLRELALEDESQLLERYTEIVLRSDEERKSFTRKLRTLKKKS